MNEWVFMSDCYESPQWWIQHSTVFWLCGASSDWYSSSHWTTYATVIKATSICYSHFHLMLTFQTLLWSSVSLSYDQLSYYHQYPAFMPFIIDLNQYLMASLWTESSKITVLTYSYVPPRDAHPPLVFNPSSHHAPLYQLTCGLEDRCHCTPCPRHL